MTDRPAEHVVVTPALVPAELASGARRDNFVFLVLLIAGLAALGGLVYLRVKSVRTLLLLLAGVVAFAVIAEFAGRQMESVKTARSGLWSKWYRTISVETNRTRRSHRLAYLVFTERGVAIRQQRTSGWGRVSYEQVFEAPWSAITTVEYTEGRRRWRSPVISGPGIVVALPGTVNRRFGDALLTLGARNSQVPP